MKNAVVFLAVTFFLCGSAWPHVTFRSQEALYPRQRSTILLHVPNERSVEISKVILEVPDAFLKTGGRVEQVQAPPGWEAVVEKQDKPPDVLAEDQNRAGEREARLQRPSQAKSPEEKAQEGRDRQIRPEQPKQ